MNANTYMNNLAKALIPHCEIGKTACASKDGINFGVVVNHTPTTPTEVISKRALAAVKMTLQVKGEYAKAEALEYLHVNSGDCLKVTSGNSVYTVLYLTI